MEYIEINGAINLAAVASQLNALSFYTDSYEFLLTKNMVIYGYFKDSSTEYGLGNLFVFGRQLSQMKLCPLHQIPYLPNSNNMDQVVNIRDY